MKFLSYINLYTLHNIISKSQTQINKETKRTPWKIGTKDAVCGKRKRQ